MIGISFSHLQRILFVYRKPPDVFTTTAIRNKQKLSAIRRKFGVRIKRHSFRKLGRLTTSYWHGENVTQKIEGDCFSIRAYIKRHPGAFRSFDWHASSHLKWKIFFI